MKISLLFTTARPHLIERVRERWLKKLTKLDDVEMIIVTDAMYHDNGRHRSRCKYFVNTGRKDCVTGWNLAAKHATGDIFVQVSDDLYPPEGWASKIVDIIKTIKADFIVLNLLDDRLCETCIFHPVMTRDVYDRLGYFYPPEFKSMWCDNWLFAYARKYCTLATSSGFFWEHKHRTTHKSVTIDNVTLEHEHKDRYEHGRLIFQKLILEQNL